MIDWSKLEPYRNDKYRSFEELCYRVAKELYGRDGSFTSVDDSGGGDGVEFYLTFPDGRQWGWQAKYYFPDGRLSTGGRKDSIKKSLQKACEEHPQLEKWFLCLPANLSPEEQKWFDRTLVDSTTNKRPTVPAGHEVRLETWGESDFVAWMGQERFAGMRHYFLGELELTLSWFRRQFDRQVAGVWDRFEPSLHTETDIDSTVHALLNDDVSARRLEELSEDLRRSLDEHRRRVADLSAASLSIVDGAEQKDKLTAAASELESCLTEICAGLAEAHDMSLGERTEWLRKSDWESLFRTGYAILKSYASVERTADAIILEHENLEAQVVPELALAKELIWEPDSSAANVLSKAQYLVSVLEETVKSDLHVLGDAGFGKTHLACHVCDERLTDGLPAIFVPGASFTGDRPLEELLRAILDVPPAYGWHDFLSAVDTAAQAHRTRIPLVIDGLNEAAKNGAFSDIWRRDLPRVVSEISGFENLVLITTCRSSYREETWPDGGPDNLEYAQGFDWTNVEEAVQKYFGAYKIAANLTLDVLEQFTHPIYLRIFCETKNPDRNEMRHVHVGQQTLFGVFDEYLERCNRAVCRRLAVHPGSRIVGRSLERAASYMWEKRTRRIPLSAAVELIDGEPLDRLQWQTSRTRAIESEGLLVNRDWGKAEEDLFFTYDLMGGYLIAQWLIDDNVDDLAGFFDAEETLALLYGDDHSEIHPLSDDIRRCVAALLPMRAGCYLHGLTDHRTAFADSVEALFEIPSESVDETCVRLVSDLFDRPSNRRRLLEVAASTVGHVGHPLDAEFWHERLTELPMPERDLSWTEHVRVRAERLEDELKLFEERCKEDTEFLDLDETKLHLLARHFSWVLTSTVRPLRDRATRALYWYGRRFPQRFFSLVRDAFKSNDPYVLERMLAAAYGVAMAHQCDLEDETFVRDQLPVWGRELYEALFSPGAPHGTTHVLARDYARRTIDLALVRHPDLLSDDERRRARSPFADNGRREWGESEDRDKGSYSEGNAPLHMDFANYTLGGLVEGRRAYDDQHEEYKKVRANIYWRLYDLGYSLEAFEDIDRDLNRQNWSYGRGEHGGKTDRYGKKYSWIAFFELFGARQDRNELPERYHEWQRPRQADIDPSFPEGSRALELVREDLLGDRETPVEEWIEEGGSPDMESYLIVEEVDDEVGPWVLLDGYVNQEDPEAKRGRFVFLRGLVVRAEEAERIVRYLERQDLGGRWLPEIPEDHYTYAGEVPWCETFPSSERDQLAFKTGTRTASEKRNTSDPSKDAEPSSDNEEEDLPTGAAEHAQKSDEATILAVLRARSLDWSVGTDEVEEKLDEYEVFEVLVPVRDNAWDDQHSSLVPGRNVSIPARQITDHLSLCGQPQTHDLYAPDGRRASITTRFGENSAAEQHFTFLRHDLLDRYLRETNGRLVWGTWGEREFISRDWAEVETFSDQHKRYAVFQNIRIYAPADAP